MTENAAAGQVGLPGILVVLSGPSGVGKTTVAQRLIAKGGYRRSVSVTTRPMREGEVDGRDYHFVARTEFERMRDAGELMESAEVHGNFYGTPKQPLRDAVQASEALLLVIDVKGGQQVQARKLDAFLVFLVPPDRKELARRLGERATEDNMQQTIRLNRADIEFEAARELYDEVIINKELDACVEEVHQAIQHARKRLAERKQAGETLYPGLDM